MRKTLFAMAAIAAAVTATAASAQQIAPTGYSAPGWSGSYPDSGGELTDGVIANRHFAFYTPAGAPYVGWDGTDPTITFSFAGLQNFGYLIVWIDNNHGAAGVGLPKSLSAVVNGTTYSSYSNGTPLDTGFTYEWWQGSPNAGGGTPMILSLAGAAGDSVAVSLVNDYQWTFVSEVQFFAPSVPEPGTWAMMIGGFGLAGGMMRRRGKLALA